MKHARLSIRCKAAGWFIAIIAGCAHAAPPGGSWWDANYNYRRQVTIATGGSGLVNNYSLDVVFNHATEVSGGRSLNTGNDVRLVWWNGTAWVELDRIVDPDSTWNNASTSIWFETQAALGTGVTDDNYYLYYGNPSAGTPPQNGDAVFLFYDDFSTGSLDTAKWTASGSGTVTVSGGALTVPGGAQLRGDTTFGVNTIWETRARMATATPAAPNYYWSANSTNTGAFNNFLRFNSTTATADIAELSTGAPTNFNPTTPTAYQNYSFSREGAGGAATFFHNGTSVATYASGANTGALRILLRNEANAAQTQQYEWARVRNYRASEPTPGLGSQETYTPPAPIASYSFEQTSYTSVAGEVIDSSANALHGRAYNGATTANATPAVGTTTGTCRYATFDGANDYIAIPDSAQLDITAQFGFAAWVRHRTNTYKNWETILAKGDTAYRIHLNGGCNIAGTLAGNTTNGMTEGLNGGCGTADLNTNTIPAANTWYHLAATHDGTTMKVYLNGTLINQAAYSATVATNNFEVAIGENTQNTGRQWTGDIDEVAIWNTAVPQAAIQAHRAATHSCAVAPHFVVQHDGNGINCLGETITVYLYDASNNLTTGYSQQVTLDTGTGKGDWALQTGAGTLNNGTANDGVATYQWSAADNTARFTLTYREGAASTNINVYQTSDNTVRDLDTEGNLAWSPNGFTVTSAPLSNPPPGVIPAFPTPQVAGTTFNAYITAYGQTPTDATCGVIEAYTGNKNLKFWPNYVNPGTGTRGLIVNGVTSATSQGAATTQSVTFTNGQSNAVTVKYKDVGQISIGVKDDTNASAVISGSSSNFISKPHNILLSAVTRLDNTVNSGTIVDQNSTVFMAAGRPFKTTITVRDAENSATPNFGRETSPETVGLVSTLFSPTVAGSNNPAVVQVGAHTYTNGVATDVQFSWPEVGVITMAPHIQDSDYLGSGDVSGTVTGNVGRFIPDHFDMSANTPQFQTACGAFTYLGQPFRYAIAPVVTATAKAFTGETTRNYTGSYLKLSSSSVTRTYQSLASLSTTAIPAGDVAIAALSGASAGLTTLTFTLGTTFPQGLAYTRGSAAVAPIASPAAITLDVSVTDSDLVASTPSPFTVGSPGGITFNAGSEQRYGRIAFRNAVGSELLNLPLPMQAEYFLNSASGFATSTGDSCTTGVSLALGGYGGNLQTNETCILDTGTPGLSGVGCSTAGPVGQQFRMPPLAGDFVAILRAPGAGNDGTVTVTTVVPAWLRFDWNATVLGDENPSGVATFGLFKGEAKRIFQSEK